MVAGAMAQQRSSLGALLPGLSLPAATAAIGISAVTLDSRAVQPGALFLACAGGSRHGMDFLSQALDRGASAILCEPDAEWPETRIRDQAGELTVPIIPFPDLTARASAIAGRFYGDPSCGMLTIGITGTNGKTSCAHFIARALQPDRLCGVIGTLGNGFPDQLSVASHTTPDPTTLQATLAQLKKEGATAVAMEVSSHALDQGRVAAIEFDLAVLTNLSRDHLDYHGDMAAYAAAKKRLFQMPGLGCAILNMDDELGRELALELASELLSIGYGQQNDPAAFLGVDRELRAVAVAADESGLRIRIESDWGSGDLHSPLLGRFNVSNLLAVLAVLLQQGTPLAEALARLSRLTTVPGRMERFGGGDHPLVVVDYAHTPDALEKALLGLRDHTRGRIVCLFGCGGDRDRGKRPQMGRIAERLSDISLVTDDNPRSEDGDRIIDDILAGMQRPQQARVQRDRARAIREAIALAGPGDVVLVAGKGHETTQQVGEMKFPFSDREQVAAALGEVSA